MAGGAYEYFYRKIENLAEDYRLASTAERRAFASLLSDVAEALHDIEWVDSDDYAKGSENAAIERCLSKEILLEQVIAEAKAAADSLSAAISQAILHPKAAADAP
jgi:RecB family exonuclease